MKTVVKNIGLLATARGKEARKGREQGEIQQIAGTYIVIIDGRIATVGGEHTAPDPMICEDATIIDAGGALVTPGLVDAHTHLLFAGWRQKELALKLQGVSYLEILKQGGGILHTVNATRRATPADLVAAGQESLGRMLRHGTTTCEVKSGYGLTVEDELKSLAAVRELNGLQPVDLVATFMGAHAIPVEYQNRQQEYVRLVCDEMIPAVAEQQLAVFCDVFCEDHVFNLAESGEILACGRRYGLLPKIHADEITPLGGAALAGEVRAVSAEHLIYADDKGLAKMAASGTVAVLLPGTSFYLGEDFARARAMVEMGIPVAIATDFNPGSCPNESLQLPMNLACLKYRLTPAEVLTAVTLNGAAALCCAHDRGTVEEGKAGDLVIWQAPDLEFLFYHWGVNLVKTVIKGGEPVL
ncbi:metal-dependent hydrolase [Lucifera butyrica]|uniref:Imidazolonepropionase n=1 Tax=Lucifera butyrica TaxID=1351585 RepID=A0A498R2W9_9FIRM|nr:imidazolonepropionase [Lucifera butyrica]VBB05167.1 metal-dependent hydrolase [Lucifera butyrica]